jgi:magnesium chelatase subunit D
MTNPAPTVWDDALLAAALLALDPAGLGGAVVRAPAGPVRDGWMAAFRALLDPGVPVRRMPAQISDDRLLGGLDLTATLRAGRPVATRGLLAELDGGVLVAGMAERLPPATAARLAAALDDAAVRVEREGVGAAHAAKFGLILLDEGEGEDPPPASALGDRLAFWVDLGGLGMRECPPPNEAVEVGAGPPASVACDSDMVEALCGTALALGVMSIRATLLAVRAARAAAALAGRAVVTQEDAAMAARLVLAPRATRLPQPAPDQPQDAEAGATPSPERSEADGSPDQTAEGPLDDRVLQAAAAAIPAGLLARLLEGGVPLQRPSVGRAGVMQRSPARGRPAESRPGDPRGGQRLDLIATLRAAAPWQGLRRLEGGGRDGILVRRHDLHVVRRRQRTASVAIFVVDASGSAALNRLAEAKGAVELLLADCYVRRDQVALIAFRGRGAELLLPPTRSLARAKRTLAGLPGGGGTPLCAGIEAAVDLAEAVRRRGLSPLVVLLTDGRPNVARGGAGGRRRAESDTLEAARRLLFSALPALLVDVAPQPHPFARDIAAAMGARYLALPAAQSATISRAVQAAMAA